VIHQAGESVRCVNLYPVTYPDGEIQYVAWPEAAAAAAVELVWRGAISAANWIAGIRPKTLLLWGCGVAALCAALADDRSWGRRR